MKTIICPNCGGEFDASLPKCPYCDYINPEGAEDEFFDKLEGKKEELEALKSSPEAGGSYADELKKTSLGAAKKILIIAVVLIVLILIGVGINRLLFGLDDNKKDYSKELAWQNEHFDELDKLYDEENYDELISVVDKYETDGHEMWRWNHYAFVENMRKYNDIQYYLEEIDKGHLDKDLGTLLLYDVFSFCYRDYENDVLDQADLTKLDELSVEVRDIAHNRLGFNDDQLAKFESEVCEDGFIDFKKTEKIAGKYYKNFR